MASLINVRHSDLFDLGDLSAPPGSRPWVRAVYLEARAAVNDATVAYEKLETWVSGLVEDDHYRQLVDEQGQPFRSWATFCMTRQPFGLGYAPEAIAALMRDRQVAATAQERAETAEPLRPLAGRPRSKERNGANGTISKGSNQADYLAARLARDRPDLLERVKTGEFRSVRRAAKEAGWVSPAITVRLDDPSSAARTLRGHATAEFLRALILELTEEREW